jgi:AcrR family transcriptional regulator
MSRKKAILEAATQLFAQKGFSSTPTADIAKRAGVAEGLIFHYFKTKEGILVNILLETTEHYLSGSRARIENCRTGLDAIKACIGFHFEFSSENSDALAVLIRDVPSSIAQADKTLCTIIKNEVHSVTKLWEECIDRGKRDGTIRDVPTLETALTLQGMLNGVSRLQILESIEAPDLTAHIIEFCVIALRGIV